MSMGRFSPMLPPFGGRHAGSGLESLAEVFRVGEAAFVGYVAHVVGRVEQESAGMFEPGFRWREAHQLLESAVQSGA